MKELKKFNESKHTHIFLKPVDDKLNHLQAMIIGPEDTVFVGNFFVFDIYPPNDYPFTCPKVIYSPPRNERLHPNLYGCGKVCLSILGTWAGEPWSPLITLEKLLMTISALLDNNPLQHEPSFDVKKNVNINSLSPKYKEYSINARYISLNFVLLQLNMKGAFINEMKIYFKNNQKGYLDSIEELKSYDNVNIKTMHNDKTIDYKGLKSKIEKVISL